MADDCCFIIALPTRFLAHLHLFPEDNHGAALHKRCIPPQPLRCDDGFPPPFQSLFPSRLRHGTFAVCVWEDMDAVAVYG
ncbi:hypothetical protein M413DRAFT_443145 [Hebeloma cylindrosporum]|uniref:Uncharacterized protein n=1 Tax=Hebeloma cylindrosporum TaxID=76867 RepID=A0A0C2YSZ8_HEBCY|nr:hypothetical protein M413DRAFT_443145 [Hebeloma cylindrosporum h7]